MLQFTTKREYFQGIGRGIHQKIKQTTPWHLKSIQDTVLATHLDGIRNKKIAEIGDGNSSFLDWLSKEKNTLMRQWI